MGIILIFKKQMAPKTQKKISKTKKKAPVKRTAGKRGGRVAGSKPKRKFFKIDKKWNRGLYRVLKQVHPGLQTTKKAMIILNSIVNSLTDKLHSELLGLSEHQQLKSLSDRNVQTAVKLSFPGELARHACVEGAKASANFRKA